MPEFSVKKPLTIFVVALSVLILGIVAYLRMTPDLLPNMDFPYVIIMTTDPGASPEKVESEVTRPIEQSMATLEGIVNITSNSADNYSLVTLEFEEGTNLDTVGVDIQQKISALEGSWPETVAAPYILKINPSMLPVAMAAVSMEGMDIVDLSEFMEDTLMGRLEGVSGVARVTMDGMVEEQLHVVISQEKIEAKNKEVAKGINKQLDKAVASLNSAKNQITGAMSEMGNLSDGSALDALLPDTSEIDKQLIAKKAELASIEAIISALEKIQAQLESGSQDDTQAIAQLRQQISGLSAQISELNTSISAIDGKIAQANLPVITAESALANHGDTAPEGIDPAVWEETKAQLEAALAEARAAAEPVIAALNEEKAPFTTQLAELKSQRDSLQAQLDALENKNFTPEQAQLQLDALDLGISVDGISQEIAYQKTELNRLNKEIDALTAQKAELTPDLSEMLGSVINGMLQMSSAMSQIDSGLSSIETSRKDALSQADLNTILSLDTVSQILYAQNFSMPAGYVKQDGINYMVSVGDNFSSIEELENLMLFDFGMEGMDPIYLKDVADIFVTDNSKDIYTRLGTNDGIMLCFEKQSNYATAEVSEGIKERFAQLEAEYEGLEFFLLMDQGDYIRYIVNSILESLLFGALFSVLVLFIFLKDVRPTCITLLSIPLSLLFAIVLM